MRRKKNRQQQAPADPAAARLAELVAHFRAQGISEQNAQLAARHQLAEEQQEERERLEREGKDRVRRQMAEWYERGEMRACPDDFCLHRVFHAPEGVIPEHRAHGPFDTPRYCGGSGAIVTESEPMPEVLPDRYNHPNTPIS
jgi:hypothetical protein